ncbi:PHB depolymerase family esterase [Streptomyces sp. LBUM 1478]|uniref:extracellular catalytic domain type 1 short-chain-length polyhydroxyalkanoate depolymerase n=1 Tax=Streptomyces scabiei TaxID=1930 RepID=UPI000765F75B|nr:PHB depolymerase family esterase [Streptomyces scabiei]MBP5910379.1 PHB depolymerase family esterase [Streptomyces sp. LBUM 1478]MBP5933556.1 PHB depolymerase family esterase [Streptomyces sp. LBUM 1479]MDX2536041.1 PHB depolymerase family esterase [Streptomyces scabiei]MDX2797110.1 PHB depolymerase family esterase [Streptomyces scabiei]MDX2857561.1 PHB depolymerase family esterase [Streptomyces scabiei]
MTPTPHHRARGPLRSALRMLLAALVPLLAATLLTAPAAAASDTAAEAAPRAALTEITGFGTNPSNLQMYLYVPQRVTAKPAIVVAVHYCTGSGPAMYNGTEYASLADRYGFIVVYPSVTRSSKCFDVASPQALTRGGGSDPVGIKSMVDWTVRTYGADTGRIFATGISSGAMMTNVLLGDYPDVFAAGAAFAGVPFACFATTNGSEWNSDCANGTVIRTPQAWGNLVRGAHPGYTGPRPRMQLWHGTTDDVLRYPNFGEEIKQWTNVHGVGQTPAATDSPQSGWTRTRYGSTGDRAPVEAISLQGTGHNVYARGMGERVLTFFGLTGSGPGPTPEPPAGPCKVTVTTQPWSTGLTASVTLTNTGTTAVDGWKLGFTLPAGQTVTSGWGATYSPATGAVTATNAAYNAAIAPGASVSIGYQANHTGNSAAPSAFTLNEAACTGG